MSAPVSRSASRYRRRILLIGALATLVLFVVGAPFFSSAIEQDLERRVPEALTEAGFAGITADFSGQDGVLTCQAPLDAPEQATKVAYDVWGVHRIELERSCRVNRAPVVSSTTEPTAEDTEGPSDTSSAFTGSATGSTEPPAVTTTTDAPDFATIADIVATDPEFSLLLLLVNESSMAPQFADPAAGPFTFFAPSADVLAQLDADVVAALVADPERVDQVLSHLVVDGHHTAADLTAMDGTDLTALDGEALAIASNGDGVTVGGAALVDSDLTAANGVVHVIDALVLPDGVDLVAPDAVGPVTVTLADGGLVVDGLVAGEAERERLIGAAGSAVGLANVIDQVVVDAATGVDAAILTDLEPLVLALPVNLVSGTVGVDADGYSVTGFYATDADRDAMLGAAAAVGAMTDLQPRPDATDEQAATLESELNAYVAGHPITFAPNSADLTPEAFEVIDRIALGVQQFGGVAITVEGHTDSDGNPSTNLRLSQLRADAVRDALVERGLAADAITAEGFGSEQPVVVDGVEDKDSSRRVEFRVVSVG